MTPLPDDGRTLQQQYPIRRPPHSIVISPAGEIAYSRSLWGIRILAVARGKLAIAEATARLVAEQAAALGRRTTAEHLLAAQELEDAISKRSRSRSRTPPSSPAGQPTSPTGTPVFPSGTSDLARLMQYFADREIRTQQAADEREVRREQAAADRDARREAQHAAQLAALRGSPPTSCHPGSFTPNKGFNDIKPFSWARGQDLLPWLQQLRSRASFLKTPADDVARELCFKLTGDALLAYNQRPSPDSNPTPVRGGGCPTGRGLRCRRGTPTRRVSRSSSLVWGAMRRARQSSPPFARGGQRIAVRPPPRWTIFRRGTQSPPPGPGGGGHLPPV